MKFGTNLPINRDFSEETLYECKTISDECTEISIQFLEIAQLLRKDTLTLAELDYAKNLESYLNSKIEHNVADKLQTLLEYHCVEHEGYIPKQHHTAKTSNLIQLFPTNTN